jgi:hypothetical protein
MRKKQKGFTAIEMAIGVGIATVISVFVVVVLNPVEIAKQSRDGERVANIELLDKTLQYVQQAGAIPGSSQTVYVSIPDSSPTCQNSSLPILPVGWTYHCAPEANYQNLDGTGWLPFATANLPVKLTQLPIDPINTASGGYYAYLKKNNKYELVSSFESIKYSTKTASDGGSNPLRYEVGPDLSLSGSVDTSLVALWHFDETSGTTATDSSGNGNNGTLVGTRASFAAGKSGNALQLLNENAPTTDSYVTVPPSASLNNRGPMTVSFWMKPSACCSSTYRQGVIFSKGFTPSDTVLKLYFNSSSNNLDFIRNSASQNPLEYAISGVSMSQWYNNWNHVAITWNGSFGSGSNSTQIYLNGVERSYSVSSDGSGSIEDDSANPFLIGTAIAGVQNTNPTAANPSKFTGLIDEMRVYNRVLSVSEIAALVAAQ